MTRLMRPDGLRKSSLWMMGGQLVSVAFQAVYFVQMGRTLGSREYGAFIGVVAMITVLTQFSSLGMEMILVRNLSRDRASFAETWGNALRIAAVGFLLVLVAAMVFGRIVFRPEMRRLIPWIAFSDALFGKFVQMASRAFQGVGNLRYMARLTACINAGRAALAGLLFVYARNIGGHATAVLWARIYWLSPFTVAIVAAWLVTSRMGWPRFGPLRRRDLSEGFSFSLSGSSISLYNDIDKTFLVSLGETYQAGIYSAAYRVVDVASAPLYSIYAAATPRLFREGGKSVEHASALTRRLMLRTVPYGVLISICLYCGAGLLPHLFGPTFQGSVQALRWLCVLPLLRVLHYAWGTTITASASQWNRTATQLAAAALNLALNAVLIPRWSWQGAAVASLLTDGALVLFSWLVLARIRLRAVPAVAV
jgi:O-antigen/teichoic acid export membrane protein